MEAREWTARVNTASPGATTEEPDWSARVTHALPGGAGEAPELSAPIIAPNVTLEQKQTLLLKPPVVVLAFPMANDQEFGPRPYSVVFWRFGVGARVIGPNVTL